jgi:predicted nucleotidyltransferase
MASEEISIYRQTYHQRQAAQWEAREKARQSLLAHLLAVCSPLMAGFPSLERAYLFGSITKPGRFRPTSDIDVAVVGLTAEAYPPLWDLLEAALGERYDYAVDLRPLPADTFFGQSVMAQGILLYERAN